MVCDASSAWNATGGQVVNWVQQNPVQAGEIAFRGRGRCGGHSANRWDDRRNCGSLKPYGEPHEVSPGIFTGISLLELLADALQRLAEERGGAALTEHRPGCWEAERVRKLVGVMSPWPWVVAELEE